MKTGVDIKRVQVLPDVPAIDEELTYLLPPDLKDIPIGSIVQIPLQGRKIRGWITSELEDSKKLDYKLKEVLSFESYGPPKEILELADWAAHRWVGRRTAFYRAASPNKKIKQLPSPAPEYKWPNFGKGITGFPSLKNIKGSTVFRVPPLFDIWKIIEEILNLNPLIIVPFSRQAHEISKRLKSLSLPVALLPDEWAKARGGNCIVVGTRPAIFAPVTKPGIILLLNENDESHISQSSPTYNTREIAQKRASDLDIPCLLVSSSPSQEALSTSKLFTLSQKDDRLGWPKIEIVDCGDTERQMEGLITTPLLTQLRKKDKQVLCILNRKGRIRLLACQKCKNLIKCKRCSSALQQNESNELQCLKCQLSRPYSCRHCKSKELKQLRLGVSKLRENLELLLKEPVAEITTANRKQRSKARILVATTAALYEDHCPDVIAFLDFDQQLLAPHFRAHEQAFTYLTYAASLLDSKKKLLLVQTHTPDHCVIDSVLQRDPDILSAEESKLRKELELPPEKAVAEIARNGADDYIADLKSKSKSKTLEILGPVDGSYLVKANSTEELSEALNQVSRPPNKELRIAVNPARL